MTTGDSIKSEIMAHLIWDDSVDASRIQVEVADGKVVLTGSVPSLPARVSAERDARMVPGVKEVENQLRVQLPPGTASSDEDLTSRVETVLGWDALIKSKGIQVQVANGLVTLGGSVDAYWKKFRAEDLASDVAGVVGVANRLKVAPKESATDNCIASEVYRALRRALAVDADKIGIDVKDGIVTLSGTVPTWDVKFDVEDTAKFTAGVRSVVDNLEVE